MNLTAYIKLSIISYYQLSVISRIVEKKFNIINLLRDYFTFLIRVVKSVKKIVIEIDKLEYKHK